MKKIVVILLALAISFSFLAGQEKTAKDISKEAKKILKEADKLREKKNFEEALLKYDEVIKLEPDFAFPYFYKGAILKHLTRNAEALAVYEKGLALMPNNPQAQQDFMQLALGEAQTLMQQGKLAEANEFYIKIVGIPGVDKTQKQLYVQLLLQIADSFGRTGSFDNAFEYLDRLMVVENLEAEFKEIFVNAHMVYGVAHSGKQDYAKANEYLEKFITLIGNDKYNPFYPIAAYYIGANNYSMLDAEMQDFNKQILALNQEIDALTNDTKIKAADKKKKDKELAEKMVALKQSKKEAAQKHEGIQQYLADAINLQPAIEQAYVYLGNYFYYCEDYDNAIKYYQLLINNFPASGDLSQYKKFLEVISKSKERAAKK